MFTINRSVNDVVHCKIGKKETGYGFADPFFIHETLMDLVLHYKDTSLVEHNDELDVMLDFPAKGTIFTKPHNKLTQPPPSRVCLLSCCLVHEFVLLSM